METLLLKFVYFILIHLVSEYVTGAYDIKFRLKTFDDQANDGIAHLLYNGTWGAVDIADPDSNGDFTAKALCNSFGFQYEGFTSRNYNGSQMLTWINGFTCDQRYAANCTNEKSLKLRNTNISAIVHCYAYKVTDIRLTGDTLPGRGFVELKITERWVAVNASTTNVDIRYDRIGDRLCQALGYVGENVINPERRGSGDTIMALSIQRTGQCLAIGSIFDITGKCETKIDFSTSSFTQINCMPIRLVDGPSVLKGRVEATLSGRIYTICGLGFDINAAIVACKSLGFSGLTNLNLKTEYGVGNLTLYSRKISCNGTEYSLEQCNHSNIDIEPCGKDDVVSVSCKGNQVQLEKFSEDIPYEGLLTAYFDSHLYYMYYRDYPQRVIEDTNTARTVCSMLGFGSVGFFRRTYIQRSNTTYYKSNFACKGNEQYIDECDGVLDSCPDCEIYMMFVFGLFCSDYKIQRINLVNKAVELTINNKTWSVCARIYLSDAYTVCRIQGHTGSDSSLATGIESTDKPVIGWLKCEPLSLTSSECKIIHMYELTTSGCINKALVTCNNECRQGYFGKTCSECKCKSVNTQSCNVVTGECICKQGWSGITCSDDRDECSAPDICKNPSTCVNTAGSYFCQCPVGMYMKDGHCEVSEVRETGSSLLITAILSSIGGAIVFAIIITAVVCCIRKHKETSDRKQNVSQGNVHSLDTIDYTIGRVPADAELDENTRTDNRYQVIKEENDDSNGYIEFSGSLNDNYDVLDYAKMRRLRSEDLASDGYLKPIPKDRNQSGKSVRPRGINDEEPGNNLTIMASQQEDKASNGYLHPV